MEENKFNELIETAAEKFNSLLDETRKSSTDNYKELEEKYTELKEEIKAMDIASISDNSNEAKKQIQELHEKHQETYNAIQELNKNLADVKDRGVVNEKELKEFRKLSKKEQFAFMLDRITKTDEFKTWKETGNRGNTRRWDINELIKETDTNKAVTGIAADHTGSILISEKDPTIRDTPRMQPQMRDYLTVRPTDEPKITFGSITFDDVYNFGTQMLTENEAITDVNFDTAEVTSDVARLGISMPISKRYFRGGAAMFADHVIDNIPDAVGFKETMQILFGDGSSDNLNGIITDAREFDLTPQTYLAGAISSVATWDSGTRSLITFASAHGLLNGDKLTIANASESTYNATHEDIIVKSATEIIINLTYVAEADTAAWTGTGASYWYQLVESAQEFDVLSAAQSILSAGLYTATACFLNPQTIARIATLKGGENQYIGVARNSAGNLTLNGMPIIPMNQIPAGWFLIGDFSPKSVEIREYSPMQIQLLEDVTTKKGNYVVVLASEEIHLVKHNPNWYIFDRFSTAKTALETPAS